MLNRELDIRVGPPVKRFCGGVVYWREERSIRKRLHQIRAVMQHNRAQRRLKRWHKKERKREFMRWRDEEPSLTLEDKLRDL